MAFDGEWRPVDGNFEQQNWGKCGIRLEMLRVLH